MTVRRDGSIRETVLSSASSTQTAPSPTATVEGVVPSGIVASSSPVFASWAPHPAARDRLDAAAAGEQEHGRGDGGGKG